MIKRLFQILAFLALAFLMWYFGFKPNDYNISFKAPTSTGHAYNELLSWNEATETPAHSGILETKRYGEIRQEVNYGAHHYVLNWSFTKLNDSVTGIKAGISEPGRSFWNRITIPFTNTTYEERTLELVLDYKSFLEESLKHFNINIEGEATITPKFCACTRASTTPQKKAMHMMRDYNYLTGFIQSQGLTPKGKPLVQVLAFDDENNILEFDFCFPVIRPDSLPESPDIFFKEIGNSEAIKAIYHGDYRFSNKSWYHMFEYATRKNIRFTQKPLEVYHNNPNMGGDALKWTTEIYLPIEKL